MQIGVPKETWPGEVRAAMVPTNASKLINQGFSVSVQSGLGSASGYSDAEYAEAGATVSDDRASLLAGSDIVMAVRKPDAADVSSLKKGALYVSFLDPFNEKLGGEHCGPGGDRNLYGNGASTRERRRWMRSSQVNPAAMSR